mmetsp:Transcript_149885/g.462700  ORF Transcript_149885/g.462700 Transcript_149885/m.462700 type:complete len:109 (+) Transcript_149885:356-682(+)
MEDERASIWTPVCGHGARHYKESKAVYFTVACPEKQLPTKDASTGIGQALHAALGNLKGSNALKGGLGRSGWLPIQVTNSWIWWRGAAAFGPCERPPATSNASRTSTS